MQADVRTSDGTAEEAKTIEDFDLSNSVWATGVWMSQSQPASGTAGGGGLAAALVTLAFLVLRRRRAAGVVRTPGR